MDRPARRHGKCACYPFQPTATKTIASHAPQTSGVSATRASQRAKTQCPWTGGEALTSRSTSLHPRGVHCFLSQPSRPLVCANSVFTRTHTAYALFSCFKALFMSVTTTVDEGRLTANLSDHVMPPPSPQSKCWNPARVVPNRANSSQSRATSKSIVAQAIKVLARLRLAPLPTPTGIWNQPRSTDCQARGMRARVSNCNEMEETALHGPPETNRRREVVVWFLSDDPP